MLTKIQCLMCKNLIIDNKNIFEHKCKAYPNGIPDKVFNNNNKDKACNNGIGF